MLFVDCVDKYLTFVEIYRAPDTFVYYRDHLKPWINFLGVNKNVHDISVVDINRFILLEKKRGVSNSTINKRLNSLKQLFRYCELDLTLFDSVHRLRANKFISSSLDDDSFVEVLRYVESSKMSLKNKLMVLLFVDTGVRRSEMIYIKIENINLKNNLIYLDKTKTCLNRYVSFYDSTKEYLVEYLKEINRKEGRLFYTTPSGVSSLFERIKKQLGIDCFSPHKLRHTFATKLMETEPIAYVQKLMGHRSVTQTMEYMHADTAKVIDSFQQHKFY